MLKTDTAIEVETIARWLNIPENQIDVPKGKGAFLDCVQYLTHESDTEQAKSKYRYADEEVKANFDWRGELNKRIERKLKYGQDLDQKNRIRYDVLYHGKTLKDCRNEDRLNYLDDCQTLEKLRHRYLTEVAQVPTLRINFYIDGDGGVGKNTAAKILAKSLFSDLEKPYFVVGGTGVAFQQYDGEPVVIWNDKRASGFIADFGREQTFDILDMHPSNSVQNIKYGSIKLINSFNIINGIEPYEDFLDGLAGEYTDKNGVFHSQEDKSQSYRRFPIILCIRENDFDCLINKGVAEGTREFQQYIQYLNIQGSFARVAQRLEGIAQQVVGRNMLASALNGVKIIQENETKKISNVDDIPEEFKDYGMELPF